MLEHTYISLFLFTVSVGISWIVLSSKLKSRSKVLIVGLVVASGLISYRAFNEFYGYPGILRHGFSNVLVIGHLINSDKQLIYLWLKEGELEPRSYTIPFNPKTARFLEQMRAKKKGQPYRIKMSTKTNQISPFNKGLQGLEIEELSGSYLMPPKAPKY